MYADLCLRLSVCACERWLLCVWTCSQLHLVGVINIAEKGIGTKVWGSGAVVPASLPLDPRGPCPLPPSLTHPRCSIGKGWGSQIVRRSD